ncbi:MAG TPA: hypothetical protein DD417_05060 [Elusimicrobia bacterium]|nr:hypothetical protein [Elusimicrobiota bacterium]
MPDETKRPKPKAFKFTLHIPVEIERISNGEKVIHQAGPDECISELVDDDDGEAVWRLGQILKSFATLERDARKNRAQGRLPRRCSPGLDEGGASDGE